MQQVRGEWISQPKLETIDYELRQKERNQNFDLRFHKNEHNRLKHLDEPPSERTSFAFKETEFHPWKRWVYNNIICHLRSFWILSPRRGLWQTALDFRHSPCTKRTYDVVGWAMYHKDDMVNEYSGSEEFQKPHLSCLKQMAFNKNGCRITFFFSDEVIRNAKLMENNQIPVQFLDKEDNRITLREFHYEEFLYWLNINVIHKTIQTWRRRWWWWWCAPQSLTNWASHLSKRIDYTYPDSVEAMFSQIYKASFVVVLCPLKNLKAKVRIDVSNDHNVMDVRSQRPKVINNEEKLFEMIVASWFMDRAPHWESPTGR